MPKASLGSFTISRRSSLQEKPSARFNRSGGLAPTASGANSVASALGNPARRDPGEAVRTYHEGSQATLKIGTFYFGGNRNFLLWSDTAPPLHYNMFVERISVRADICHGKPWFRGTRIQVAQVLD